MGVVVGKLKVLKSTLKVWNKKVFGKLDRNIEKAYTTLIEIQNQYNEDSFYEELFNLESYTYVDLDRLSHQQDIFL